MHEVTCVCIRPNVVDFGVDDRTVALIKPSSPHATQQQPKTVVQKILFFTKKKEEVLHLHRSTLLLIYTRRLSTSSIYTVLVSDFREE